MAILVGTDFSENSARALTAAAHLAARMHEPLHLVHALELAAENDALEPTAVYIETLRSLLDQRAERLRSLGAMVTVHVERGSPDDVLLTAATQLNAKLVVVAALGKRKNTAQLGGHADRLAQRSHVPVLVVRDAVPFEQWAHGVRPLRVLLGADLSQSAKGAMQWLDNLRKYGPCDVTALHLFWQPLQFQRLGLDGVRSYLDPDPLVTATLTRELTQHLCPSGENVPKLRLEPHLGRLGDRVSSLAQDEHADLVLIGSHPRNTARRVIEGSVSHIVLRTAAMSVCCVPAAEANLAPAPKLHNVLVATDFSATGNAAIAYAYAIAPRGAVIHIAHVDHDHEPGRFPTDPHDVFVDTSKLDANPEHRAAHQRLTELVPSGAASADKVTRLHILESNDPARAIAQAAERVDADVLCLGTHGRTALTRAVLGSVAQAVLSHTHRPVLLTRKPVE